MKKNKLFILLLVVMALGTVSAYAAEPTINGQSAEFVDDRGVLYRDHNQVSLFTVNVESKFEANDQCYGDQLDNNPGDPYGIAKKVYNAMVAQMPELYTKENQHWGNEGNKYFVSSGISKAEAAQTPLEAAEVYICAAKEAYDLDYPEMCHTASSFSWLYKEDSGTIGIVMEFDTDVAQREKNLEAALDAFYADYIKNVGSSTRLAQYQYIHDYLCERLYYNHAAVNVKNRDAHNAYGALVGGEVAKGDVVCEGYADAFQLLCKKAKLPCLAVPGESFQQPNQPTGVTNHIWNYIQLEDGTWYAVDATWDDVDNVKIENTRVSTMHHNYFTDNHFFLTGHAKQNHAALGDLSTVGKAWMFDFPALDTAKPVAVTNVPTGKILVVLDSNQFSDALYVLGSCGIDGLLFGHIPNVTIELTQNTVVGKCCSTPNGYSIKIQGKSFSLTRDPGYANGCLFSVNSGGPLKLFDVTVDGENKPTTAPLIKVNQGATVLLGNATITRNQGACGIQTGGTILVGKNCTVDGNFSPGNTQSNVVLENAATIVVCAPLEATSKIGVTAGRGYCITPEPSYSWTPADRAVFTADNSGSQKLIFEAEQNKIYCGEMKATAKQHPVSITYVAAPTAASAAGESITLTNCSADAVSAQVYAAAYDASGKMVGIQQLAAVENLAVGVTSPAYQLPTLGSGAIASYQVFVLSGTTPISEKVSLPAA
ncbi:MAG: transglutaminase domain-containing protein [Oscillospiraceae bacterium]